MGICIRLCCVTNSPQLMGLVILHLSHSGDTLVAVSWLGPCLMHHLILGPKLREQPLAAAVFTSSGSCILL